MEPRSKLDSLLAASAIDRDALVIATAIRYGARQLLMHQSVCIDCAILNDNPVHFQVGYYRYTADRDHQSSMHADHYGHTVERYDISADGIALLAPTRPSWATSEPV